MALEESRMKNYFDKDKPYLVLKGLLEKEYDGEIVAQIWSEAEKNYIALMKYYKDASKGERRHLHKTIIPRIAMYQALCGKLCQSEAMSLLDDTVRISGTKVGMILGRITNLPGMASVFMFLFSKMVKTMFGSENGFTQVYYEDTNRVLRFDVIKCPYCKYCQKNGCPELTHTFCDSDVYCYGNMARVRFERTQTLGTGGECCDFKLTRI